MASPSIRVTSWFIAAIGALAMVAYSIMQWRSFAVPSWDQGIFTELAKQYAYGRAPIVDIKGPGFNLLGDHFHPLLVLLGPVYRLFPSGLTLLVVQDLLFALSSVPITALAMRRLGATSGVLIGLSVVFGWGLWSAVAAQFHEIAFAVPLLAFGLCRWLASEGRSRAAHVLLGALVFVKEDLGLTVAAFGLVAAWWHWGVLTRAQGGPRAHRTLQSLRHAWADRRVRRSVYLAAWGLVWVVVAIAVAIPLLSPSGSWQYTGRLDQTEATANLALRLFLPPIKYVTLTLLAAACGVLGCLSPLVWVMAPTLAWRFLGNVEAYWGWSWHYSAVLVPIAAVALIDAGSRWRGKASVVRGAAAVACAVSVGVSAAGPLKDLYDGETAYSVSQAEQEAAWGALAALDESGSETVVANLQMLAYAVPHHTVYWEGTVGSTPVDAVILGSASSASMEGTSAEQWAASKLGGSWSVIYSRQGFQVAIRNTQ